MGHGLDPNGDDPSQMPGANPGLSHFLFTDNNLCQYNVIIAGNLFHIKILMINQHAMECLRLTVNILKNVLWLFVRNAIPLKMKIIKLISLALKWLIKMKKSNCSCCGNHYTGSKI